MKGSGFRLRAWLQLPVQSPGLGFRESCLALFHATRPYSLCLGSFARPNLMKLLLHGVVFVLGRKAKFPSGS